MALSFMSLILLAVLGLFVVGGIAALCNKKTRWLGYLLLLLLPVGLFSILTYRVALDFEVFGEMTMVRWSVFAIPILAIVVVGSVALLVALLSNRRTRPIGFVLLAVPLVLGGYILLGLLTRLQPPQIVVNTEPPAQVRAQSIEIHSQLMDTHLDFQVVPPQPSKPSISVKNAKPKAKSSPKQSGRVVEAIGTALGKTFADLHSPRTARAKAPVVAPKKFLPKKPAPAIKAPPKKTADKPKQKPADKKAADKKTAEDDSNESDSDQSKNAQTNNTEQIGKMVEVLSVAVQQELPENVEIDRLTVLRSLGKLLGRMIASEQQAEQVVVDGPNVKKTNSTAKPASGLETRTITGVAGANKFEPALEIKKTSAVAVSVKKTGASNDKRPPNGKVDKVSAKASAKSVPKKSADDKKDSKAVRAVPDWIGTHSQRVADGYQIVIRAGPYSTREECEQVTNKELAKAVSEYGVKYFATGRGRLATLEPSFLRKHVIKEQWEDIHDYSVGPMNHIYTRLVFDTRANTELEASYRRATIEERLWIAGGVLGVVLILMGGCFAVLKFDQATEGEYRGRMVFAVFFAVVMATAVLGTRYLTSLRSMEVPASYENSVTETVQDEVLIDSDANTPVFNASGAHKTAVINPRDNPTIEFKTDIAFLTIITLLFGLVCPIVIMLFFRKTRKIAQILLSLGVAIVVGALLLVALWS